MRRCVRNHGTVTQSDLQAAVRNLLPAHETVALCLDFDGTLAPIVPDPNDAILPDETREQLAGLAANPVVDIAVISGRALEDIRSRVDIAGIKYAGNHGLELQGVADMRVHPALDRYRPALERTAEQLELELQPVPGCFIEDKYATLTVHHRRADTDDGSFVIATVQSLVDSEDGLSMSVDKQAVEVCPDIDYHKGDAIEELIDIDSDPLVIYLGDAQTDVDAFRTLAAADNDTIQVSVGSDLPASGYHLESPADVERFLGWLRKELNESGV